MAGMYDSLCQGMGGPQRKTNKLQWVRGLDRMATEQHPGETSAESTEPY
jgi:hypothetical protein